MLVQPDNVDLRPGKFLKECKRKLAAWCGSRIQGQACDLVPGADPLRTAIPDHSLAGQRIQDRRFPGKKKESSRSPVHTKKGELSLPR